ncbi:MAG: endonuclease Q family protein [Patescibacteria group bacterium]
MQKILDLHIHSKYSRACSKNLTLPNIDAACRIKGIDVIATGDFTHPQWFSDIKNNLTPSPSPFVPYGEGGLGELYKLKSAPDDKVKFILSAEISLIYKDGGKARRIHLVLHAPNVEAAEKLNNHLKKSGYNIKSDGRPILGMKAPDLVKLCLSINPRFLVYPAHIWTPWFSVFGSKSGFDSMEECFQDQTEHIYALETGLSSDPEMNWRVSALDPLTIISNSDAHSPANLGREANIMDLDEGSYDEIYGAIKSKDLKKLKGTIEFYPEEGMYHFDGHRDHNLRLTPAETKKNKGICPVCKKPVTIGVVYRVDELADRVEGFKPKSAAPFIKLVGLDKIIAEAIGVKARSAIKVRTEYDEIIKKGGTELDILMKIPIEEIKKIARSEIAEGIRRVRAGELQIEPGFDGQYGTVRIFSDEERLKVKQKSLF